MDSATVTNQQLYLAIGLPMLFNAVMVGMLIAIMNAKLDRLEARFEGRFAKLESNFATLEAKFAALEGKFDARFEAVNTRLDGLEARIGELKELWRSELRRVEEVLDARLRQLEIR